MTATRKEKLEFVAKIFFEDCKDDEGYPHKNWREQFHELEHSVKATDEFIEFVYEANRDRIFKSDLWH